MSYYQSIAENFQATIEAISLSVDELAGPIERGSELIVRALLEDRKVMACGNGVDAALAQLFCANLLSRFEQERPGLPAFAMAGDGASVTAIAEADDMEEIYARQLRALGQAGDLLLCIGSGGDSDNLLRAIQAAHERNMAVIALSNEGSGELSSLIRAQDVELRVGYHRRPQVVEIHAMAIHCLCELVEHRLFGSY